MREILLAIYQAGVEGMSISEAIEGAVAKFKQEIEGVENPNPFPKALKIVAEPFLRG